MDSSIEPTMARWPWTHRAKEKAHERKGVPYLTYATSAALGRTQMKKNNFGETSEQSSMAVKNVIMRAG